MVTILTFLHPQSTLQCALLPVQAERPCASFVVCVLPARLHSYPAVYPGTVESMLAFRDAQ